MHALAGSVRDVEPCEATRWNGWFGCGRLRHTGAEASIASIAASPAAAIELVHDNGVVRDRALSGKSRGDAVPELVALVAQFGGEGALALAVVLEGVLVGGRV
jgi:hypothetical protein